MPKRRGRRKRGRTVLLVVLSTAFALSLVTVLAVTFAYQRLDGNIDTLANADDLYDNRPEKVEGDALNILLIGSDMEEDGVRRSDTTILMHLSGNREFAYGVSLPRDAIVDRPDCIDPETREEIPGGDAVMFNTAYADGGAECTQHTVEQLTGVPIDAVVEMDFEGFEGMVDSIGGVEICLTEPIEESRYNKELDKEGTFTATGAEALIYVRERHQLSTNGDIGRMKRQQAFLASLANQVVSADTLTSPTRLYNFADAATSSVAITEGYDNPSALADLGLQFNGIGLDNIQFITVPNAEYEPDPDRLEWTEEADVLWDLVLHDQPLTAEFLEGALTAEEGGGAIATNEPTESSGAPSDGGTSSGTGTATDGAGGTGADDSDPVEGLTPEEIAEQNGLCA